MTPRHGWLGPVVAIALGATAGPAAAAYAPQFSLTVDPATAGAAPALTSTITQAAGETPHRTVTVTLPPGFGPNLQTTLVPCPADAQLSGACPESSRMGSATAAIDAFGLTNTLTGPVFYGGLEGSRFKLLAFLNDPVLGQQRLLGLAGIAGDGSLQTVFDNLPPILVTKFTLALEGGARSLLRNPATCLDAQSTAAFVSQAGEQASGASPLRITGCDGTGSPAATPGAPTTTPSTGTTPRLRIGAARLSRLGRVTFTLSRAQRVTVTVTRAGRRVARRSVRGRRGTNRVRLRRLRPGRYVVTVRSADGVRRRTVVRVR
jgi:hypothetical protein